MNQNKTVHLFCSKIMLKAHVHQIILSNQMLIHANLWVFKRNLYHLCKPACTRSSPHSWGGIQQQIFLVFIVAVSSGKKGCPLTATAYHSAKHVLVILSLKEKGGWSNGRKKVFYRRDLARNR